MKLSLPPIGSAVKSLLSHLLPLMVLAGFGGIVVGAGSLGLQFILEPKSVAWLNDYLPENLQVPLADWDRPHTLEAIKSKTEKGDAKLGEWIELPNGDRLVSVSQPRYNCISLCDRITELRIYRSAKAHGPKKNLPHYRMIAQVGVPSANDRVILESLKAAHSPGLEVEDDLPLETLETLEPPKPNSGTWLNLYGKRTQGDNAVTYGQLFHYDSDRVKLTALIQWASPATTPLQWIQFSRNDTPELLIDHSIGLEPSFRAYRLNSKSPPELVPISLLQPALKNSEFQQAIKLAQVGLWSIAADRLKQIKDNRGDWSPTAQAQFDLIQYHAKATQTQTKQNWSNATQQVLAQLLDGQWKRALEPLEKDPTGSVEVREGIALEVPRLWKRITTALEDDPGNPHLQAWMARLKIDRDGKAKAIAWINQQGSSPTRSEALKLLAPELIPAVKSEGNKSESNKSESNKPGPIDPSLEAPTRFNTQPLPSPSPKPN
jgi:hypothetical protein